MNKFSSVFKSRAMRRLCATFTIALLFLWLIAFTRVVINN